MQVPFDDVITDIGILCVDRIVANVDRMIVPTTIAK